MKSRFAILLVFLCVLIPSLAAQEQPFYFVMIADPQMGMYTANRDFVRETANYEFVAATINRLRPAFVIVLGDLVNKTGDPDQIREFKRISGKIDSAVPIYYVAGNHDVDQRPTPATLAAYRENFGRDYYSFRAGPIYGIVLDSSLIQSPQMAAAENVAQISWLKEELEKAKQSDAKHVVVFQHHPYFINAPEEPEQYFTIPLERRQPILELLHQYNIHYVFSGHTHQSSVGKDGNLEMTVTGPVAMPFGEVGSGICLAEVTAEGIRHRYFTFGKMPDGLAIK